MWNTYSIYLSGWGLDRGARSRFGVDHVLPFSDHADYSELIEYVRSVSPKMVYCTHGFEDFKNELRGAGFMAQSLHEAGQTDLFAAKQ